MDGKNNLYANSFDGENTIKMDKHIKNLFQLKKYMWKYAT